MVVRREAHNNKLSRRSNGPVGLDYSPGVPDRIKRKICTSACEFLNPGNRVLILIAYEMCGAELLRKVLLAFFQINRYNRICLTQDAGAKDIQAYSAKPVTMPCHLVELWRSSVLHPIRWVCSMP